MIFDYKGRDFKEIRINEISKKYFILIQKDYIEVTKDVYLVLKADYMRSYRLQKQKIIYLSYEEYMSEKDNNNLDMDRYHIHRIEKETLLRSLGYALKKLNKEEYYIIYSLFFNRESEAKVAKKLNITQQTLNWRKKKILLFLKNTLLNLRNRSDIY